MKVVTFLTVAAAVIAVTCGSPVNLSLDPDWPAANAWNSELINLIVKTTDTIKTLAINDNPSVGEEIGKELELADTSANESLEQIQHGINIHNLTVEEAGDHLDQVKVIYSKLLLTIDSSIQQLSPSVQKALKEIHIAANENATEIMLKLLFSLAGLPTNPPIIDWALAELLVEDLRIVFNTAITSIASIAVNADPTIGGQIASAVNTAGEENNAVLTKIQSDITTHTLTKDKLEAYLKETEDNFYAAELKVIPLLDSLPERSVTRITNVYDNANEATVKIVMDLHRIFMKL